MEFIKKGKEEASVNINILLCGYPWFRTNHPRGLTKGDTGFFFFFFSLQKPSSLESTTALRII